MCTGAHPENSCDLQAAVATPAHNRMLRERNVFLLSPLFHRHSWDHKARSYSRSRSLGVAETLKSLVGRHLSSLRSSIQRILTGNCNLS